MTNLPATRSKVNVAAAAAALDSHTSSGQDFMKFNANTGQYTYGRDEEQIEAGSILAVDMMSFSTGWIFWKDSNPEKELMARLMAGEVPLNEQDLPPEFVAEDDEDGWQKQSSVKMYLLDTENKTSKELLFKTSANGGLTAMAKLFKTYAAKIMQAGDDAVPVIELDTASFMPKEKKHGKKYAPIFTVAQWTTESELAARYSAVAGSAEDDPSSYAEEPKALAAPAPAPAVETPAPAPAPVVETPAPAANPVAESAAAAPTDAPTTRRRARQF